MNSKTTIAVLGSVALAVGAVVAVPWKAFAHGEGRCRLEGTWIGTTEAGTARFTVTFVPDSPHRSQIVVQPVNFSGAVAGLFEDSRWAPAGLRGEGVTTGRDTFDFSLIAYGIRDVEGQLNPEISYLRTDVGNASFIDCDTIATFTDISFFTPDADADNDGFPDEGAAPIVGLEVRTTLRRLRAD